MKKKVVALRETFVPAEAFPDYADYESEPSADIAMLNCLSAMLNDVEDGFEVQLASIFNRYISGVNSYCDSYVINTDIQFECQEDLDAYLTNVLGDVEELKKEEWIGDVEIEYPVEQNHAIKSMAEVMDDEWWVHIPSSYQPNAEYDEEFEEWLGVDFYISRIDPDLEYDIKVKIQEIDSGGAIMREYISRK